MLFSYFDNPNGVMSLVQPKRGNRRYWLPPKSTLTETQRDARRMKNRAQRQARKKNRR